MFLHPYVEVCLCLRAEHRARAGNEVVVPPVRGNRMADTLLKSQTGRTSESQSWEDIEGGQSVDMEAGVLKPTEKQTIHPRLFF